MVERQLAFLRRQWWRVLVAIGFLGLGVAVFVVESGWWKAFALGDGAGAAGWVVLIIWDERRRRRETVMTMSPTWPRLPPDPDLWVRPEVPDSFEPALGFKAFAVVDRDIYYYRLVSGGGGGGFALAWPECEWAVRYPVLVSGYDGSTWEPGAVREAVCGGDGPGRMFRLPDMYDVHGPSPARYCGCGFYGLADLPGGAESWGGWGARQTGLYNVLAVVEGWGRVQRHRLGWRSQSLRIAGIFLPGEAPPKPSMLLGRVADHYGVPVVRERSVDEYRRVAGGGVHRALPGGGPGGAADG